jgi:putative Ca2+/H+ antiporter (TMEM165/GDT1 family)
MNWTLFATAFGTVFLAELGDKTQLATLALATQPGSKLAVFLGASLALVCTSALGVLAAEFLARTVSPVWVHRGAGVLFLVLGLLILIKGE